MKNFLFLLFFVYYFSFSRASLQISSALENSVLIGMVLVPEGLYISGSNKYNDERPSRQIYLDAFYIDKFEVTQKEFKKIMNFNPSEFRGESFPVDRVDWYQARDYCNKSGKRLPTEAEWEKAARSGSESKYYWGEEADDSYAWHWDNSDRKTRPVGEKRPNKLGLYDTAGNVWEWTADWYSPLYYTQLAEQDIIAINPQGPEQSKEVYDPRAVNKSVRGGSFLCNDSYCASYRVSARMPFSQETGMSHIGFRCARD